MSDERILEIVKEYFGREPILDMVHMWWSTSFSQNASKEAAQWFHFDLDRMNWLKVFVYLTDVKMTNGPHCYVEGSHKTGNKPQELLDRGYERISDSEIRKHYKESKIKYLTGLKGEIFIGNTKAWHKGTNLKEGNRLILQLQFTDSFFLLDPIKYNMKVNSDNLRKYLLKNPEFLKGRRILNRKI
jgi:ectoine hydroxylase-related dioxygenase (phytanoyl-CoA dioxygenase family)